MAKKKTVATPAKTRRYDVAEYLRTPEEMAAYLEACLEEADGGAAFVAKALGDIARTRGTDEPTFTKTQQIWKIYWQRSDLRWHSYPPKPQVRTLEEFIAEVDADPHGCFWG